MVLSTGQIIEFLNKDGDLEQAMVLQTGGKGVRVLQLNRRETTVTERSVLHLGQVLRVSLSDLDACGEACSRVQEKRVELATAVDLSGLHELLADEVKVFAFDELVGFACDPGDADQTAALLRKLHADRFYFRKKKDGYMPVSRDELAESQRREALRQEEERKKQALLAEIKRWSQPSAPEPSEGLRALLPEFLDLLLFGEEAAVSKLAQDTAREAGLENSRKMHAFLQRVQVVQAEENLLLKKHRVPVVFSENALQESRDIVRRSTLPATREEGVAPSAGPEVPTASRVDDRRDLRHLRVWVLDNASTRDRDDGFSVGREPDGSFLLRIHIADAAAFILPGSALDEEARRRGTTLYFPDTGVAMLPEALSEDSLGLNDQVERWVMTHQVAVSPDGAILGQEIFPAVIRISCATSYQAGDERVAAEEDLQTGVALARILKEVRRKNGAVIFPQRPEGKISVEGERIQFDLSTRDSPCQDMIAEFMIWTNHLTGLWFKQNGIPGVFRVQEAPPEPIETPETFQPTAFYRMIRSLSKTQLSSQPGRHGCLGVDPYLQITSPMRRYGDLLLQRQLKNALNGGPVLSAGDLMQVFMQGESAASVGESIMQQRYRYFLIRYLKQIAAEGKTRFAATVLDAGANECQVFLDDLGEMGHCRKPAMEVKPGQRVEMKFTTLDPFDIFWRMEIERTLP